MVNVSHVEVQGFAGLTLENGLIAFTIVPELGGKLTSLRDLRTGREWLWSNPRLPYRRLPYGTSYVHEADTGGWDECFPTVAACVYPSELWHGLNLPDHGEIWSQAWAMEVVNQPDGAVDIQTQAQGVGLPYLFERRIQMSPDTASLRFDYNVRNTGDTDMQFIWSAHPLIAIEPGMRILLPHDARLHHYISDPDLAAQDTIAWPVQVRSRHQHIDFTTLPDPSAGVAFKLWSDPLADGWAAVAADNGEFRFTWDSALLPQVGLWMNAGAWSGVGSEPYYNLGLEPCIGAQDSLEEAVQRYGQYAVLPANDSRAWWLEARLLDSSMSHSE